MFHSFSYSSAMKIQGMKTNTDLCIHLLNFVKENSSAENKWLLKLMAYRNYQNLPSKKSRFSDNTVGEA